MFLSAPKEADADPMRLSTSASEARENVKYFIFVFYLCAAVSSVETAHPSSLHVSIIRFSRSSWVLFPCLTLFEYVLLAWHSEASDSTRQAPRHNRKSLARRSCALQ
jgi:hypothetical protein